MQHTRITNAQMLALRATAIEVAPAPGVGRLIWPIFGSLVFDHTAAYTETADNMQLRYSDESGAFASAEIESTGFVDASGDAAVSIQRLTTTTLLTAALSNAPVVLHNIGDGEFGGGDAANVVHCSLAYLVVQTRL